MYMRYMQETSIEHESQLEQGLAVINVPGRFGDDEGLTVMLC